MKAKYKKIVGVSIQQHQLKNFYVKYGFMRIFDQINIEL